MKAAVVGASGALGQAFVESLVASRRFTTIHALSRQPAPPLHDSVSPGAIDVGDPGSIAAAAASIIDPLDVLLIATGLLHEGERGPERAMQHLDAAWLARVFAINTIGPALVLRHFTPLLPRSGRSVVAALSARVGSTSDNRAGGWYGYRASKAALNMIVRSAAIELARRRPEAVCVALHPGTVDSELSRPFQAAVPAGKLFRPRDAAQRLVDVLDQLTPEHSGRIFAWDGKEIAP